MSGEPHWAIDTINLPVMKLAQPVNVPLCGIYGRTFAYYTLTVRLPRIINKIIENCSDEGSKIKSICKATDEDLNNFVKCLNKLKNDLLTNKCYELFTVDTPEARKWNSWIQSQDKPRFFTSIWLYSECYVYRKIREGCELNNGLSSFDPFEDQKCKAFDSTIEMMCIVAEKLATMLPLSEKQKQKEDFINLLKLCLWSNQCDLSLTVGNELSLDSEADAFLDPFKMIKVFKDKLLADHSERAVDYIMTKAENMRKDGQEVIYDIVCDNAGYELFADLCVAQFLIAQKIVQKIRFHVKDIPWFVSDVTPKDFKHVIQACRDASFSKTVAKPEPRVLTSEPLRKIASQWQQLVDDGTFVVMNDDFWTSPHMFKDMRRYEPALYAKLQDAVAVMFKGDLNCRKLLNEMYWPTSTSFDDVLLGFHPTAVISVRTVKSDLVCGLPPGRGAQLDSSDDQWMQTGEYGTILFSEKIEPIQM